MNKQFSNQFIDSLKSESARRLQPEKAFYPVRAGIIKTPIKHRHQAEFNQPHYALVYVVKGFGQYTFPNGRTFPLLPGSLLQRFPNQAHVLDFALGEEVVWAYIGIPVSCLQTLRLCHLINEDAPVSYIGCDDEIVLRFQQMITRIHCCPEMGVASLITEMQQFAIDLLNRSIIMSDTGLSTDKLNHACEVLRSNIDQRIDIQSVANELKMSYSKFRKLFRQNLNISPGQYRINYRIEKGCELLRSSSISVENIGKRLGYRDVSVFSRQFKKVTGLSPKQFRLENDS